MNGVGETQTVNKMRLPKRSYSQSGLWRKTVYPFQLPPHKCPAWMSDQGSWPPGDGADPTVDTDSLSSLLFIYSIPTAPTTYWKPTGWPRPKSKIRFCPQTRTSVLHLKEMEGRRKQSLFVFGYIPVQLFSIQSANAEPICIYDFDPFEQPPFSFFQCLTRKPNANSSQTILENGSLIKITEGLFKIWKWNKDKEKKSHQIIRVVRQQKKYMQLCAPAPIFWNVVIQVEYL